ncbi:transporter substrate-binding domain-containing protein [Leucothrix arctica]|uniref:Solute-binding protein family 3/N-terminal domain-containing protein n=1 Tax=Leucothrix arctica TaxID=1481894 RepID=A0A317CFI5_9GAMM|nr:transporter substrate-binding domain-containing protein [Leucothrix arctica]PWQ97167.1 hypothetical protein DKT75_07580 [Leucothrix arctica]
MRTLLITLLIMSPWFGINAASNNPKNKAENQDIINIGVTANRKPFIYLNEDQSTEGILIQAIESICTEIDARCLYTAKEFPNLLYDLQNSSIQLLLVIDDIVLPEIDQLTLSEPLCHMQPLFIQASDSETVKPKPEDYKKKMIGVRYGSMMHLDLLDNYSEFASLRPYGLLESGVFDLVNGRIDALYTEASFYHSRVKTAKLISNVTNEKLQGFNVEDIKLPQTHMRLAADTSNADLIKRINAAIKAAKLDQSCLELLMGRNPTHSTTSRP